MEKKIMYAEPECYIPEELQKKYGLGKYYKRDDVEEVTSDEADEKGKQEKEESDL